MFFGLVATLGTTFVQVLRIPGDAWWLAVAAGLFSCAVLMINNIRDIDQDRVAGKRTLAVLVGRRTALVLFTLMVVLPFAATFVFGLLYSGVHFAWFSMMLLGPALLIAWTATTPKELILALKLTSFGALAWAVLTTAGIVFPIVQAPATPF